MFDCVHRIGERIYPLGMDRQVRIVCLASGSGTNFQALLDADLTPGQIIGLVSDNPNAKALKRAQDANVPTRVVPMGEFATRDAWNEGLIETVEELNPDLVVLAGFMRILAPAFVSRFITINIHPALLPSFPGAHGARDALAYGVKITGCTVHLVDAGVDTGPIIEQAAVPVLSDDTPSTLQARIQQEEHRLYPTVIKDWCNGAYAITTDSGRSRVIRLI